MLVAFLKNVRVSFLLNSEFKPLVQVYKCIYVFLFRFFLHIGHHRVLRRVLCAPQWVLLIVSCMYVTVSVSICTPSGMPLSAPSFPFGDQRFVF